MLSSFIQRRALPLLLVVFCLPLAALKAQPVISITTSAYAVELGGNVVINGVRVTGQSPLTYQWVAQGANNSTIVLHDGTTANGSTLSGTTGTVTGTGTLTVRGVTLSGATAADAGTYGVEVTDANGASATSAWITLTVKAAAPPTITSQPGNVTVVAGNNASFSVSSTGSYPRTYQWYKGTPGSGSAIAGATTNPFTITGALAGDAGSYYVTVTNAYGSDTSAAATLTVNPATPITFNPPATPAATTVGIGVTLTISTSAGSTPISYQWQKDGVAIPGATSSASLSYSNYTISSPALTDSGTYTVVATNAAGTATSPGIVLNVNPPTPVSFAAVSPVTANVGQHVVLSVSYGGTYPIQLQWQKDGTAIAGATTAGYSINAVALTDSGNYTVVGTNAAGSTTSGAIALTVIPAVLPAFTQQPANVSIAQGNTAQFSVTVSGSTPLTYQWLKNGAPIANATSSVLRVSNVQSGDAGSYAVTVANPAGSVTSASATLTVLPPVAPAFSYPLQQKSVVLGGAVSLAVGGQLSNGAVGPFSTQWFKDGVAIPGATNYTYTISNAQLADAGTYGCTVTNAGGTADPLPIELSVTAPPPSGTAWIDAVQQGSIVYFLFAQHLERYDLAANAWLPSTNLTQTATAICAAADGIYVGCGRALLKYALDLSTQTTLANLGDTIGRVFSLGNYVYAIVGTAWNPPVYPIDRATGAVGAATAASSPAWVPIAVSADKVFTSGEYGTPMLFTADATGKLIRQAMPQHGNYVSASRAYLMPDQQHFANNAGGIFNASDADLSSSLGGTFTDVAFLGDGTPVILRDNVLYRYAVGGMKETAHLALPVTGVRVFVSGANVLVFYPGTSPGSGDIGLTQVAASAISATYPAAPTIDASRLSYTPAATIQDRAGTTYLLDPVHQVLLRWSPGSQAYAAPIPLTGYPTQLLYSGTLNQIYCLYDDGRMTRIDLGAATPAEQPFACFTNHVLAAIAVDNFVFANLRDGQDSDGQNILLQGTTGAIVTVTAAGQGYGMTWSSANQTMYSYNPYGYGEGTKPVTSSGGLPAPTVYFSQAATGWVFPSPDGSRLVTSDGQVFDASGQYLGAIANKVMTAVCLGTTPYTLRSSGSINTEIQAWSPTNFQLSATARLPGTPTQLFNLGANQLLVVTQAGGVPTFTVLNAALQRVNTTVPADTSSTAPTFVSQPAASLSVYAGTAVTLAVDTNGSGPQTFQWYKNGVAIAGATSATFQIPAATSADAAAYHVTVTNGIGSTTSTTTTLTVSTVLAFTSQPRSQTAAEGATVTFQATVADATGASYQWYCNGTAVSGATSNTLVISPVSAYANYGTYVLRVSNTGGAIYSTPATLSAPPQPPFITAQPQSVLGAALGSSATFSVAGQNVTAYQWYFEGSPIVGGTTAVYSIPAVSAANVGNYYVVLTGPGGNAPSNNVILTLQTSGAAPTITTQPQSTTVSAGGSVTLLVAGSYATAYQWYLNGTAISGATGATLVLNNVTASNAGTYTVALTGPGGTVTSNAAVVTVQASSCAGVYFGTINGGGNWAMWVPAAGSAKFIGYLGSTNAAIVADLNIAADGTFGTTGMSNYGRTGSAVTLPSSVTGQISSGQVTGNINNAGGNITGTIDAGTTMTSLAGAYTALALNGVYGQSYAIVGGSGQTLALWVNFQGIGTPPDSVSGTLTGDPAFSGTTALGRAVTVSLNANTGVLSESVAGSDNTAVVFGGLAASVTNTARLLNLSARANVGTSADVLIAGFSIAGSGTKGILVRGVGPTLKNYGLTNVLNAPQVMFADGSGAPLWSGTAWGGGTSLIATFNAVGAFPLDPTSADAAHTFASSQGRYTATVAGADGGTGIALAEVYDTDGGPTDARLMNLSARASVQSGAGVLTAGLVVGGNGPETVLLRGVGPALKGYGIADYLVAPQLTLCDAAGKPIVTNTGWTDAVGMTAATENKVGAFALAPGSADCVIIATLMPGSYTVQVTSQDPAQTGVALVEVYEVP